MRHTTPEEDKAINEFLNVKGRTVLFNREDRDLAEYAKSKGYKIIPKDNETYDQFVKDKIHVWHCIYGWVNGKQKGNIFINRRYFKTLKEALDAE
jgi:hypothetical protein